MNATGYVQSKWRPKIIKFNSRHHDMTSIERYVGQSIIACIYDVAYP